MKIIISGGIGSGKTSVCNELFHLLKHYVFHSVDQFVKEAYQDDEVKNRLDELFGTHDQREISDLVFADHSKMTQLQVSTPINAMVDRKIVDALNNADVVLEFPTYPIHGVKYNELIDKSILIKCDKEDQIERVQARSKFTKEKVQSIIATQLYPQVLFDLVFDSSTHSAKEIAESIEHIIMER
jgi:dephospho-CoA kinase